MSIQAYQNAAQRAESPRDIEYRAFAMATSALLQVKDSRAQEVGRFVEALDRNRRLWALLAADCAEPGNRLPDALKAQIISLAMFVERQTRAVLREGGEVDPLIDINRTIMEGLGARGSAPGR